MCAAERPRKSVWIIEGPRYDVPGTDEVEWDEVELTNYPVTTAYEAWTAACLPGLPCFGVCRVRKAAG